MDSHGGAQLFPDPPLPPVHSSSRSIRSAVHALSSPWSATPLHDSELGGGRPAQQSARTAHAGAGLELVPEPVPEPEPLPHSLASAASSAAQGAGTVDVKADAGVESVVFTFCCADVPTLPMQVRYA
jgi:hypothetical protein